MKILEIMKSPPLYQQALTIRKKTLGANHSATATTLNNRPRVLDVGDYAKAEKISAWLFAFVKFRPEHPTATSLNTRPALSKHGRFTRPTVVQASFENSAKVLGPSTHSLSRA